MIGRPRWVLGPGAVAAGRDITGPVTITVVNGTFDRLHDAIFDPEPLRDVLDLAHFTGRQWIISQIDDYIATHRSGYVVVQAEAGVGKSALAAYLAFTRPCVHHFTQLAGARSPEQARRNLAAQLIGQWLLHDLALGDVLPAGASRPDWIVKVIRAAAAKRDMSKPGQPLVLIVDGLDEADPPAAGQDTGIPLGLPLPAHLPAGVFFVVTTRFGIPLPAVRGPVDWCTITVDGPDNLADMDTYLNDLVCGSRPDVSLTARLAEHRVDPQWFVRNLAIRCAGVWIYLRYVLDDIRMRRRNPYSVGGLPQDLSSFYLEQIHRWATRPNWPNLGLPLFAILAALYRPATRAELAQLSDVDTGLVTPWLDGDLRPFLELDDDGLHRTYTVRHQSLRDLFQPSGAADRRDGADRETLHDALQVAQVRITTALTPPGAVEDRDWSQTDAYTRVALPQHAAASGLLDELVCDPGFLLTCEPPALLRRKSAVTTLQAQAALGAYELTIDSWLALDTNEQRLWWLHIWARKSQCAVLAERAAARTHHPWTVTAAAWIGVRHRTLTHVGPVTAVCEWPGLDGQALLATAGQEDHTVKVWDPVTCQLVAQYLAGHLKSSKAICALPQPDGNILLAAAGFDGTITVWDPVTGRNTNPPTTIDDTDAVTAACALPQPDGHAQLATAGFHDVVRVWDPITTQVAHFPTYLHDAMRAICALPQPDGRIVLATTTADHTVRVWDLVSQQVVGQPLHGHTGHLLAMCALLGRDGRVLLATTNSDHTVRVWDSSNGEMVGQPLIGHTGPVTAICALPQPDGHALLATTGEDRTVRVWDPSSHAVGEPLIGHTRAVRVVCALLQADGHTLLATAGPDETVRVWDPATNRGINQFRSADVRDMNALCVLPQPDGNAWIAIKGGRGERYEVSVWDPIAGEVAGQPITGPHRSFAAVCALPQSDGHTLLAIVTYEHVIQVWDPVTGQSIGQPIGQPHTSKYSHHELRVCALPHPDGHSSLATVGRGTLRVCDPVTNHVVDQPLSGHTGQLLAMCALPQPDGHALLATGGNDHTVRLWDPRSGEMVGQPLIGHTRPVTTVCALPQPDGHTLLATGGNDHTVRLWDPRSGEMVGQPLIGHTGPVTTVCALPQPDGHTLLATGGEDRTVLVWTNPAC